MAFPRHYVYCIYGKGLLYGYGPIITVKTFTHTESKKALYQMSLYSTSLKRVKNKGAQYYILCV